MVQTVQSLVYCSNCVFVDLSNRLSTRFLRWRWLNTSGSPTYTYTYIIYKYRHTYLYICILILSPSPSEQAFDAISAVEMAEHVGLANLYIHMYVI